MGKFTDIPVNFVGFFTVVCIQFVGIYGLFCAVDGAADGPAYLAAGPFIMGCRRRVAAPGSRTLPQKQTLIVIPPQI